MDILEKNHTDTLKKLALHFVSQIEDGLNHPEVWQKIAALTSPAEQEVLKQLAQYYSLLSAVPQGDDALLLISALEAVCLAHSGDTQLASQKLQYLKQNHPDSLLINGVLTHLQQTNMIATPTSQSSAELIQPILKALFNFISIQNATNTALMNKLQIIEHVSINHSRYLQQQLHDVQQTLHLATRHASRGGPNHRIRCVFLVSFLQSWNTLADVYDVMKASDDFEPIVISTARKREKNTQAILGEDLVHQFLESEGIPHIRLDTALQDNNSMDILKALAPDLIFRQSAWHDLPPVFNAGDINFARLCYIPYSFSVVRRLDRGEPTDVTSSARHTDLYYHRLCWRIFCETEMQKAMYVNTSIRGGNNVVVTGYPKFDRLVAAKKRPAFWPIVDNNSTRRRFRIIWAPHHSVSPDVMGFGTFIETHKEMLEWARQSENEYEFVLKPHPALVGEVVHTTKALSQEYMDSFFAAWNALSNTALYEGGDYGPLFVGSDAMLTDGVGFLSEYQLFEKPLLFLDSGHHFGFNQIGTIMMQSANTLKTIPEARAFCERLRKGEPDPMRSTQQMVLSQIMPYPGQSAQKIVQAIREGLMEEGVIMPIMRSLPAIRVSTSSEEKVNGDLTTISEPR